MNRNIKSIIVLVLLVPFGAFASDPGTPLKGMQIEQLISGNTAEGHRTKAQMEKEYLTKSVLFRTYFASNGGLVEKASAFAAGGSVGHVPAHGTWTVKKRKLCIEFRDALRHNQKRCYKVVPKDGDVYELYSGKGKLMRTWDRIVPGNPHRLQ